MLGKGEHVMISFVLPKTLSWNGIEVPMDFPYLSVIFQGPPKHSHDDFSLRHPKMELRKRAIIRRLSPTLSQ